MQYPLPLKLRVFLVVPRMYKRHLFQHFIFKKNCGALIRKITACTVRYRVDIKTQISVPFHDSLTQRGNNMDLVIYTIYLILRFNK